MKAPAIFDQWGGLMSVKHILLMKFRKSVSDTERQAIWFEFAALRARIDGFESLQFGLNTSRDGLGKGYSHAFIMEFYNAAARDTYLATPDHRKLTVRLLQMLDGALDGLIVIDLDT